MSIQKERIYHPQSIYRHCLLNSLLYAAFFVSDTHTQQHNRKFCLHCDMCQLESYNLVQYINYIVNIEIKLTKV